MNPPLTIRQAVNSDITDIANLLSNSTHVHKHLDWKPVLDWIPSEPFLVIKNEHRLLGLLACPADPERIAWIRCFACVDYYDATQIWSTLFNSVLKYPYLEKTRIVSVGLHDWFSNLLLKSGFENFQNIVVLQWNQKMPLLDKMDADIILRPMEPQDIPQVAFLDQTAFEPIWTNSEDKVQRAFDFSEHAYVAEINSEIVGFEFSTAYNFSAHLARIAVHPNYQRKHIGKLLIVELFKYFTHRGIHQITVNTQDNNHSSLNLYAKTGFELTGESFPVFQFEIPKLE